MTDGWIRPLVSESDTMVFIPNVNTHELLERALRSIESEWPHTVVVDSSDDGYQPACPVAVYRPASRLTFAQVQNWAQAEAIRRQKRFLVFMHADAVSCDDTIAQAIARAHELVDSGRRIAAVWAAGYDEIAVFHVPALVEVGPWDEQFTWYESDRDYYRRMRLAGYETVALGLPIFHTVSATKKKGSAHDRSQIVDEQHRAHELYRLKWGGLHGEETFTSPYGIETMQSSGVDPSPGSRPA